MYTNKSNRYHTNYSGCTYWIHVTIPRILLCSTNSRILYNLMPILPPSIAIDNITATINNKQHELAAIFVYILKINKCTTQIPVLRSSNTTSITCLDHVTPTPMNCASPQCYRLAQQICDKDHGLLNRL